MREPMVAPMGYLKTVLSYSRPSEAEVDKTFLESQGISVCLLNGETTRNELGTPFQIQLQVNETDFEAARAALRETNPQRFGSQEVVAEIDKQVKRSAVFFLAAAIPIGLIAYEMIPPTQGWPMPRSTRGWPVGYGARVTPDLRTLAALTLAIVAGIVGATLASRKSRSTSRLRTGS